MTPRRVNIATVLVVGWLLVGCSGGAKRGVSVTNAPSVSDESSAPVGVAKATPTGVTTAASQVDGTLAGLASGGRPQSLDDFDDWMVATEAWADATVERELAACMAAKGFDYIPETSDAEEESQQWERYVNHVVSDELRRIAASEFYLDPAQVTVPPVASMPPGYAEALGSELGGGSGSSCYSTVSRPNTNQIAELGNKIDAAVIGSGRSEASDSWAQCLAEEGFAVQANPYGFPALSEDYAVGLLSDRGFEVTDIFLAAHEIEGVVPKDQLLQLADEVEAFEDRLGVANEACHRSSGLADQIDERIALALSEVSLDELWPG